MSTYRNHAIWGIIMALPFVPTLFYLFFALLGASIPDMDHDNNKPKVSMMLFIGIFLSVILYLINGANISALLIIFIAIIFYISQHRGFTHTLIGITVLSALFLVMIMGLIPVFAKASLLVGYPMPEILCLFVTLAIAGYFIVSRRFYVLYLLLLGVYLFVNPISYVVIDWGMAFAMLFVGALSHLILDLFTPSGLNLLEPLTEMTFYKKLAYVFIIFWIILAIYSVRVNGILIF